MIPEGTVEEQGQEKYTSEKEYHELSFVCQNVRFCITDLAWIFEQEKKAEETTDGDVETPEADPH